MKKIFKYLLILIVPCLLSSCSIVKPYPQTGLWYCEDLGLIIDFDNYSGRLYIKNNEFVTIKSSIGYGGEILITYYDYEQDFEIWVYEGLYEYKHDIFFIYMRYRANPDDPYYGDVINMNYEKFTFLPIQNYDKITK